ncbi:hypothetical protein H2200_008495 [Cladophialophora chaetospira]|uniref:Uncharacterized protein n=1 Tax=Cladophialophora chaetospira TaxID=386627 RepID=A0AA39CGH0_9EURO|nr:hypothetical protein H2200_008495 [Cladophialophora chaetospira]
MPYGEFCVELDDREFDAIGDTKRDHMTVGKSGLFKRPAGKEIRHEDVAKRCAGKCPYFWAFGIIPNVYMCLMRLKTARDQPKSPLFESWADKFDQDSRSYQCYILKQIRIDVQVK